MPREIVLDTETTGLDPAAGHRMVEVACVELVNHLPTGREFHSYLNPERDMPEDAARIHGLSSDFLRDKPLFAHKAEELVDFVGEARLVIHNASFDLKFLNAEFARLNLSVQWGMDRATDTLAMARRKYPGMRTNLDALCTRMGINRSIREKHGALIDARLLAEVYLELMGGRQLGLMIDAANDVVASQSAIPTKKTVRPPRSFTLSEDDKRAHAQLVAGIKGAMW